MTYGNSYGGVTHRNLGPELIESGLSVPRITRDGPRLMFMTRCLLYGHRRPCGVCHVSCSSVPLCVILMVPPEVSSLSEATEASEMRWNTANQQQRGHTLLLAPHRKNLFFSFHLSCSNPCFINSWRYIARMIPPSDHVCAIHMKARDPVYYNSNARRRNTTLLSDLLFIAFFLLLQKLVEQGVRDSEDRRRDII